MSISTPFIRRPIATSLLMAGILFFGAAAYPFLPVAPLPQVDFPTIQVTTQLPGADPVTMASSVTAPLERQFAQIAGVTQMTSSSVLGVSSVTVQFDLSRNIDAAAGDIQEAINAAGGQLPKNLPSPPNYKKVNPADPPILIFACDDMLDLKYGIPPLAVLYINGWEANTSGVDERGQPYAEGACTSKTGAAGTARKLKRNVGATYQQAYNTSLRKV